MVEIMHVVHRNLYVPQARTVESVCYTRRKIERSMSRGEPVTPIWRVGNKATISNSAPPSMVENHEAYAQPANDDTPAGSERDAPGIVRYCTNSDIDKSDFLRPTGLFDDFKLNYPTIVSYMCAPCMMCMFSFT